MPSELFWKAVQLNELAFRHLSSFPIKWDSKRRRYNFDRSFTRNFWWYFAIIVCISGFGMLGSGTCILGYIFQPKESVTALHCIVFGMWMLIGAFVQGIALEIFLNGQDLVSVLNQLINYEKQLKEECPESNQGETDQLTAERCPANKLQKLRKKLAEIDPIGLFLIIFVIEVTVTPPLATLLGMWQDFDPWKFIIEDFLEPEIYKMMITQMVILTVSFIIVLICVAEGFRLLPMLMVFMILPVQIYLEGIRILNKFHSRNKGPQDLEKLYHRYTTLRLISMRAVNIASHQILILTWQGTLLCSIMNFGTIRFYGIFPLANYLMFPIADALILGLITLILPYGVRMFGDSDEAISSWASQLGAKDKYNQRKFKAMRPIRFFSGIGDHQFDLLKKSVKTSFYTGVIDQTINFLISIPPSAVQGLKVRVKVNRI